MPAPFDQDDIEGILTGARMFACVSLLRVNKKARTKPFVSMGYKYPSKHFQCFALCLSYINR